MHVHLCVALWLFSLHPSPSSTLFHCSPSSRSRCLPQSSTRGSGLTPCATSAWGPWPLLTTRHPSQEGLGLRELLADISLPTTVRLRCDSTAAMGTATRQGLGRMKHVQVRDLALQQWIADGRLTLQKIASSANAADLLTKRVTECTPVSRPETWSSTVTPRQHVCWNVVLVCAQMEGTVHLCIGWISSRFECDC